MTPEQQHLLHEAAVWSGYALEAAAFIGLAVLLGNKFKRQVLNSTEAKKELSLQEKSRRDRKLGTMTTIAVLGLIFLRMCAR